MNQGALVVLKVSCVMAGDTIPASLCETEQGGTLCSGCQAPTRRCTACNQTKGIADARRGLCGGCLAVNRLNTSERRSNVQLLEEASSGVLDLIDQMDDETPKEEPTVENPAPVAKSAAAQAYAQELIARIKRAKLDERSTDILHSVFGLKNYEGKPRTYDAIGDACGVSRQRVEQLLRGALLTLGLDRKQVLDQLNIPVHQSNGKRYSSGASQSGANAKQHLERELDPVIALRVLAEHGTIKPSGQYVPNPARVLAMRFGLLPSEAMSATEKLIQDRMIERSSGEACRFLTDVRDIIRSRDDNFTWGGQPSRVIGREVLTSPVVSGKHEKTFKRARTANVNPQAIYSALLESAQTVDGNVVVRGAVPVLLARLRIRPHEAIETLEQLQTLGYVRQIDEWRSICLLGAPRLAPQVASPSQPEPKPQQVVPARTRSDPFTGIPVRRVESTPRRIQPQQGPVGKKTEIAVSSPIQSPVATNSVSTEPRREQKEKTPKTVSGPTVGELFDAIRRLSTDHGGERLVRAVIPTLSVRLNIGTPDIIAAMERLELQKAIQRKDGWRTIAVIADTIEDSHPVRSAIPSARERAEKLNLRIVDGGDTAKAKKPEAAAPRPKPRLQPVVSTTPNRAVSDELSELRRNVEELNRTVTALAAAARSKPETAPEPKTKKSPVSDGMPKLPKVKNGQHELRWKNELWLTDKAFAERFGMLTGKRYSTRDFHLSVAPLANGVRVVHALSGDGAIRTFYSSTDVHKLFHKKISRIRM